MYNKFNQIAMYIPIIILTYYIRTYVILYAVVVLRILSSVRELHACNTVI